MKKNEEYEVGIMLEIDADIVIKARNEEEAAVNADRLLDSLEDGEIKVIDSAGKEVKLYLHRKENKVENVDIKTPKTLGLLGGNPNVK